MTRRTLLQLSAALMLTRPSFAALRPESLDATANVLAKSIESKQITSAVLHVTRRDATFSRSFGRADANSMFLLGSISKPLCVTALMTLFDKGLFTLDDPLKKFLPNFTNDNRDAVTMRHLLTHTSGLPDQLPDNDALRKKHAPLSEFIAHAFRTPLSFAPGTRYQYSSMAILLATHVAEKLSGSSINDLTDRTVFQPLGMKRLAVGLGRFTTTDFIPVQTEHAAPESGGGDPTAKNWDWNSDYWRKLGAPWGGLHASAADLSLWLTEFMNAKGTILKPATEKLMTTNLNPAGLIPRGLGFSMGVPLAGPTASPTTFGHTGSTGTICWADPSTQSTCVVLTSLPARAVTHHPRDLAGQQVLAATR